MEIDKKDTLGYFIVLLISIFFINLFFDSRNLYNTELMLSFDHASHYAYSLIYGEFIFPNFNSTYGYFFLLYNGVPFIHLFPPGYFIIVIFIHFLGFAYTTAYKIVLFGLMLLYGIIPYWALRKFKISPLSAIFGTLWAWIGGSFLILQRFNDGGTQFVLGCILGIVFLVLTIESENENDRLFYLSSKDIKMIVLLFSIAIINFTSIFILAIVIIEKIFLQIKNKFQFKKLIRYYIKISIGALLLFSFYILPTLFIQWPYITVFYDFYLYTYDYSISWNMLYLEKLWFPTLITIILLIFRYNSPNSSKIIQLIRLIAFTSLFWVFLLPFFKIPMFLGLNSYRQIVYFELISPLIYGIAINFLIEEIKKRRFIFLEIKNIELHEYLFKYFKSLAILLIILISFFGLIPVYPRDYRYPLKEGELYGSDWYLEDKVIIDWIKQNTTNDGRILFQNSGYNSSYKIGGGHTSYYLALTTNRTYASGNTADWHYIHDRNSNFLEDTLYGKNIVDYSASELEYYFILYNIEYIIVWSTNAKNKFNELSNNSNLIDHVHHTSKFEVYRYTHARLSYVILPDGCIMSDYTQFETSIHFKLKNYSQNSNIIISWHDYPNWVLYLNGEKIDKYETDLGLIGFNLSSNYGDNNEISIDLIWKKTSIEWCSQIISLTTFILIISISIIRFIKTKKELK